MAGIGNARIKEAIGYQDIGVAIRKSCPIKSHAILIEAIIDEQSLHQKSKLTANPYCESGVFFWLQCLADRHS